MKRHGGTVLTVCGRFIANRWRSVTHWGHLCRVGVDGGNWQQTSEPLYVRRWFFLNDLIFPLNNSSPFCWEKPEENEVACGRLRSISHSFVVFPDFPPVTTTTTTKNDFPHYNTPMGSAVDSVHEIFSCVPCQHSLSIEHVNDHPRWAASHSLRAAWICSSMDGDKREHRETVMITITVMVILYRNSNNNYDNNNNNNNKMFLIIFCSYLKQRILNQQSIKSQPQYLESLLSWITSSRKRK